MVNQLNIGLMGSASLYQKSILKKQETVLFQIGLNNYAST